MLDQGTTTEMTGAQLAAIRKRLGLSLVEMGRALGYAGNRNTVQVAVSRYEAGDRDIPPWIARLAAMYAEHGVPPRFLDKT
jgi:transcriptional regulator with XRE-family HTH domain